MTSREIMPGSDVSVERSGLVLNKGNGKEKEAQAQDTQSGRKNEDREVSIPESFHDFVPG